MECGQSFPMWASRGPVVSRVTEHSRQSLYSHANKPSREFLTVAQRRVSDAARAGESKGYGTRKYNVGVMNSANETRRLACTAPCSFIYRSSLSAVTVKYGAFNTISAASPKSVKLLTYGGYDLFTTPRHQWVNIRVLSGYNKHQIMDPQCITCRGSGP